MNRVNFLSDATRAQQFLDGILILKDPQASPWAGQQGLSIYDFFVYWHMRSMMFFTPPPPANFDRNAAHSGPSFLPWHRYMLLELENRLRVAVNDDTFRLPYWDWTVDSAMPDPTQSPIWNNNLMGQFTQGTWRVRILDNGAGDVILTDRELRRRLRAQGSLPSRAAVRTVLGSQTVYDTIPFDSSSQGFRNYLEGWVGAARIHNDVHVWVGGDMGLGTSPNDPVFFLHHCAIDRLWASWQEIYPTAPYVPAQNASAGLAFHRIDDPMFTLFDAPPPTPRHMLDHKAMYLYDSLETLA